MRGQVMINGFATGPVDEFSLDLFAMLMSTNLGIPACGNPPVAWRATFEGRRSTDLLATPGTRPRSVV